VGLALLLLLLLLCSQVCVLLGRLRARRPTGRVNGYAQDLMAAGAQSFSLVYTADKLPLLLRPAGRRSRTRTRRS